MFEFEDISSGFHDVFLNKYADSSGPILDFYISDSMQDMLDIDICTEVATVVGGTNEFTSLINDLPSLELDMSSGDGHVSWLGGPKWTTSDFYADVGACVNPNSVIPIISSKLLNSPKAHINLNTVNGRRTNSPLPSPRENKSHLTFSPHQIKVPSIAAELNKRQAAQSIAQSQKSVLNIRKDLIKDLKEENDRHQQQQQPNKMISNPSNSMPANMLSGTNTIKLAPGIGGLTFANSLAYTKLKNSNMNVGSAPPSIASSQAKRDRDSSPLHSGNSNHTNGNGSSHSNGNKHNMYTSTSSNLTTSNNHVNKIVHRNHLVQNNKNNNSIPVNGMNISGNIAIPHLNGGNNVAANGKGNNNKPSKPTGHEYPKPAYSYSCLIAMALKNSRSGSLPVSEIYSFMCEHFPFFKTAPNGWKNSVRHNLSLNKCFEKIEKPATNGGQRKGCLWAMNPSKITKMDEEVQKWSRKDPLAIRKAMVYPENLESLERGEMKHGSSGDSDAEDNEGNSDVEENSESEPDNEIDETMVDDRLVDDRMAESQDSMDEDDERMVDVKVCDMYSLIDIEDNKEALHLSLRQNAEILESSETDLSQSEPKRARLDINYSIAPARVFESQTTTATTTLHQQQQQQQQQQSHHPIQQHQSRRKMQLVNRVA